MLKLARHVTLRQLQIFEAIGRLKNFTRVAEELFLTQSTVSTQVKHLTELAGIPLVEVVGKKTYLTEAGEIFYHACQDVINRLDNAEMAFADLKGIKTGTLKLSVISTAKYFAPEVLGKFWQLYPDIEVSLNVNETEAPLISSEVMKLNHSNSIIKSFPKYANWKFELVKFNSCS